MASRTLNPLSMMAMPGSWIAMLMTDNEWRTEDGMSDAFHAAAEMSRVPAIQSHVPSRNQNLHRPNSIRRWASPREMAMWLMMPATVSTHADAIHASSRSRTGNKLTRLVMESIAISMGAPNCDATHTKIATALVITAAARRRGECNGASDRSEGSKLLAKLAATERPHSGQNPNVGAPRN